MAMHDHSDYLIELYRNLGVDIKERIKSKGFLAANNSFVQGLLYLTVERAGLMTFRFRLGKKGPYSTELTDALHRLEHAERNEPYSFRADIVTQLQELRKEISGDECYGTALFWSHTLYHKSHIQDVDRIIEIALEMNQTYPEEKFKAVLEKAIVTAGIGMSDKALLEYSKKRIDELKDSIQIMANSHHGSMVFQEAKKRGLAKNGPFG